MTNHETAIQVLTDTLLSISRYAKDFDDESHEAMVAAMTKIAKDGIRKSLKYNPIGIGR